ncbi:hypothetical protein H5410_008871 [Solanum commersonii]|uniref:Uncharacterized protein n=1 Tax=Solanum commersonii TaxID=4109 RepID=A0A9J6AG71_SOLCO|nr:hypothetical protein H5410_008871 [Solanum commersonii]
MQRLIHMDSSMPSDKKIQQDEDERDPSFIQLLKENRFPFWKRQKEEILHSGLSTKGGNSTFSRFILSVDPKRKHDLPISRIRRAMKSNDQVKGHRDEELFDFLSDIVPLQTYQVEEEANGGQGNELHPAGQMVQPNNIPVDSMADQNNNEEEDYAVINCSLPKDAVERILVELLSRECCTTYATFAKDEPEYLQELVMHLQTSLVQSPSLKSPLVLGK